MLHKMLEKLKVLLEMLLHAFIPFSMLWTILESLDHFIPINLGRYPLVGMAIISIVIGVFYTRQLKRIELAVPGSDSKLQIEFGDIWKKEGCIAIQVNEYFDSKIGDHVSPKSLHGQFIELLYPNRPEEFDRDISNALDKVSFESVARTSGNTRKYEIGTTASIDNRSNRYLLFVLCKTDIVTLKASASIHELWDALDGLWKAIRIKSNGKPVSMSLVGGGQSGVGLPAKSLLQILMISFFYHTKKDEVTKKLTVVLHESLLKEVNLRELRF